MNQIAEIKKWFELAVPEPTDKSRTVQIGCHYEECAEMAESLGDYDTGYELSQAADNYKAGVFEVHKSVGNVDLLDSLCDQIVTAIGVAHMFGFDIEGALAEVNRSNFSKFVDGKPVFNEQRKIAKPPSYSPPVLEPFLGK